MALRGPFLSEIVESKDIDIAIGATATLTTISHITFYPLIGKLYDMTGTYTWSFLLSGIVAVPGVAARAAVVIVALCSTPVDEP